MSRDNSTANKLSEKRKDFKHSDETKAKLSAIAIAGGYGGKNRRKIFEYNGITLESSYELIVAQELDAANVKWTRPGRFPWIDSVGKPHHYTPDFYLPQYDIYLDPKNDQLIKVDSEKIHFVQEQNCIKVFVLDKQNLTWDAIKRILQENGVIGGLE